MKSLIAKILTVLLVFTSGFSLISPRAQHISPLRPTTVSADAYSEPQRFRDENLRKAVTEWLGKSVTDTIYKTDIRSKLATTNYYFTLNRKDVSDLTGMEIFEGTGIRYLNLSENSIKDLSPIAGITSLKRLIAYRNEITDLSPVENLTSLNEADFSSNQISELLPLANLNQLQTLSLNVNQISDLTPLRGLISLESLYLSHNGLVDISSLAELKQLNTLELTGNNISELTPLGQMTAMRQLFIGGNRIQQIGPLASMTSLVNLHCSQNQIEDISPLVHLTNLSILNMQGNQIKDIKALGQLSKIKSLVLAENSISDVLPLKTLASMSSLDLRENFITDLSPLTSLARLQSLDVSHNFINVFDVDNQDIIQTIQVAGEKIISPQTKFGLLDPTLLNFAKQVEVKTGQGIELRYSILQSYDGINWGSKRLWYPKFDSMFASYISSNPAIATVNERGWITGVSQGTTQITARLFGWSSQYTEYTFDIVVQPSASPASEAPQESSPPPTATTGPSVTPNLVTWIEVTPNYSEVIPGETIELHATAHFTDGTAQDITDDAEWSLESPEAIKLDKGFVTGLRSGNSNVFVNWQESQGVALINVKQMNPLEVVVTPSEGTLPVGGSLQLKAIAKFSNHTEQDVTEEALWWSATDEIANVDAHGRVYGKKEGTLGIGATFGYISGLAQVRVILETDHANSLPSIDPAVTATPTPEPVSTSEDNNVNVPPLMQVANEPELDGSFLTAEPTSPAEVFLPRYEPEDEKEDEDNLIPVAVGSNSSNYDILSMSNMTTSVSDHQSKETRNQVRTEISRSSAKKQDMRLPKHYPSMLSRESRHAIIHKGQPGTTTPARMPEAHKQSAPKINTKNVKQSTGQEWKRGETGAIAILTSGLLWIVLWKRRKNSKEESSDEE
ncbi:leucine-rich repeat domain-containing protein [Paenibacillus glufosinatiresistens]|uniref:leucine-rich repeat domain-containing protein n=1 Tax=Paenibacillus glufosinatiresistens TaxID=3070657 RepID=UPI00286E569E|nr:leucine-rich repeat domain-containing protein [Paenibacillus sp. YX.27]